MSDEDYPVDRTGGFWDRIWRGRSSSVRRGITNSASTTAAMAVALGALARVVDGLPEARRALEIHGLCDELVTMAHSVLAITDEVRAHAGLPAPPARPGVLARAWRWLSG